MAPHPSSARPVYRGRVWAIALLTISACAATWAASEPHADRKPRTRHAANHPVNTVAEPTRTTARTASLHACRDREGRTTYSQFPCTPDVAEGGRELRWQDARQVSQVRHSKQMRQREQDLLETIERDRRRQAQQDEKAHRARAARTAKTSSPPADPRTDKPHKTQAETRLPHYRVLTPLKSGTDRDSLKL